MISALNNPEHWRTRARLLRVAKVFRGAPYALEEWRLRFHSAWTAIEGLGFDERFNRTCEYYLAYCQIGFEIGALNVGLYKVTQVASKRRRPP
jgi:cyclopropane-fatty-acyl-phospholipid synthase